jgi:hypothetical protein
MISLTPVRYAVTHTDKRTRSQFLLQIKKKGNGDMGSISVEKKEKKVYIHYIGIMPHAFHWRVFPIHLTTYTRPKRTGTSIKGPTVAASA